MTSIFDQDFFEFLGTLGAIALTYVTYGYFAIQTGFIFKAQASGVAEEYIYHHLGREDYNETYPGSMVIHWIFFVMSEVATIESMFKT